MTNALIVVDFNPLDAEKLARYGELAAATIKAHDGVFLAKGPIDSLHGKLPHTTKAVIQFPDAEKARSWYHSDAYQALIPLRNEAMEAQFQLVE